MSEMIDEEDMDTQRLLELFRKLDLDGDGRIDLGEIVEALKRSGHAAGAAEVAKVSLKTELHLVKKALYTYS